MKRIKFGCDGKLPRQFFPQKIDRISVETIGQMIPVSMTLWSGQSGLRIYSDMYEIGERDEIGFLKFERVSGRHPGEDNFIELTVLPLTISEGYKLTTTIEGHIVECGLKLFSNKPLHIVTGAQPFSLAADFLQEVGYSYFPSYEIEEYGIEPILSDNYS